jgi:structural maintenance of chromosome 1
LTTIQNQYQQNQQKCEALDVEIEKLDVQLRDVKNYKRQNKDEERFVQAIQTLQTNYNSTNSNSFVYGRLQDLCHPTQRKYGTAVATAAGKDMDAIVVTNNEIGFDCIKYLREQKIGVATFLPLSSLQVPTLESIEHIRSHISNDDRYRLAIDVIQCDDENIQRAILYAVGTTVICDDLDSARELCFGKKGGQHHQRSSSRHHSHSNDTSLPLNVKAVTLGGAVISKAGTMTGGTSNKDDGDSRWKNQDIEKLRTKKEDLEAERAQLDQNLGGRSQQGSGSGFASQIEFLRSKLGNLKNREHYSKSELEYTKKTLKEKETLLQATEKQVTRLKKKLVAAEKDYDKCSKAVKETSITVKAAEDVHLAPFRAATGLRDLKAYESAMGHVRDEYQKKKRAVIEHITQLEQQKEFEMGRDMKQPITRIEKRIRDRALSLQAAEKRAIELQKKIDEAKKQLANAERKVLDATEKEKVCELAVQNVQASFAEAQATTMKHKKLLHQEETTLEKLRSKLHETLQRARVEKVGLPTLMDDDERDDEDEEVGEGNGGGRATRSSRRGSRGRSSQNDNDDGGISTQGSESQGVSTTGTLTQQTSSLGVTQYSQDDHPILVRDQEKASQIDFTNLSKTLQRRVSDRDEKKIRKDFEDKIQKATSEIESITPNMKVCLLF